MYEIDFEGKMVEEINHEQGEPRDRRLPRWISLMVVTPLVMFVCLWLFARLGGDWAASTTLPIPNNSEKIYVAYGFDDYQWYQTKDSLYIHDDSPENLRHWFIDRDITLTPIPLGNNSSIDYDGYYGVASPFHRDSMLQTLHWWSAVITANWWDDFRPNCQSVKIYHSAADALEDYPNAIIPEGSTAFLIRTCWPNVG